MLKNNLGSGRKKKEEGKDQHRILIDLELLELSINETAKTYQPCPETATLKHKGCMNTARSNTVNNMLLLFHRAQTKPTAAFILFFLRNILKTYLTLVMITFLMLMWFLIQRVNSNVMLELFLL